MNEPDHRPRGAMSVNDFAVWAGIGRTSAWKEIREGRLPELGWCSLEEISALRGKLGLPVERDQTFVPNKPLSAYAEEARAAGRIMA